MKKEKPMMNKDNIFFLYKKNPLMERPFSGSAKIEYIAVENHSDKLTIFYRWNHSKYRWESYEKKYEIDLARQLWDQLIVLGYQKTTDPYPNVATPGSAAPYVVRDDDRKLQQVNKPMAKALRNVKRNDN